MTDYFAVFQEPRRPWLDPDCLKRKFLALSAELHPDHVQSATEAEKRAAQMRFTEVNEAYNCLRDARARIHHLLELETGTRPNQVQEIPSDLADVFLQISQLCRRVDSFLTQKAATSSPLLQIRIFEEGQEWTDQLRLARAKVLERREAELEKLQKLDSDWEAAASAPDRKPAFLAELERIYRLLGYFTRWSDQIQERLVKLAC